MTRNHRTPTHNEGPTPEPSLSEHVQNGPGNQAALTSMKEGTEPSLVDGALGFLGGWLDSDEDKAEANLEASRAELSSKFVVGEGGGTKDGKAVLTPEQYEKMLRTYASIRDGSSHLKISNLGMDEEEAAEFKAAALENIATIMQTEAGRELIDRTANQSDLDEMDRRDIVLSNGLTHKMTKDGQDLPVGNRAYPRSTNNTEETAGRETGTGVFWVNRDREVEMPDGTMLPMPKDAALFHELTHAMHNVEGTRPVGKVEAGDFESDNANLLKDVGWAEREEHHTVGLGAYADERITENAYRRQRRAMTDDPAEKAKYAERESWASKAGPWDAPARGRTVDDNGWPT
jgi:hypothetical protein